MCRLTLFGAPALACDGRRRRIARRKARALLAYLAVTRQVHTREALVALLWPEHGRREGRADLSRMLSTLRNALGAGAFVADRETVALAADADLWVDVVHFRRLLDACRKNASDGLDDACRQKLVAATGLYADDFLAGFTLPGCPAFDEWQRQQGEALRRDLGWALAQLVRACEQRHDLPQAIDHARRWVALDPLHERAQRRLIALYARNGQRAAALRQYQACERVLVEELGVEPEPETRQLYEQIQSGSASSPPPVPGAPLPQDRTAPPFAQLDAFAARQRLFVGRRQELARLNRYLDEALAGNGRVVFVTGDAGRGKTSLLQEFAHRALASHPDLVVAGGSGNAFAGAGDPYLPFREVMSQLAGDVAAPGAVDQVSRAQAQRLWALMPATAQAILHHGPQLLDVFVPGKPLLARVTPAAPAGVAWLVALHEEVSRRQEASRPREQAALFGQFAAVLHHLAQQRPLLLTLDDLQWLDDASISLLFHLGRRLAGSRILIAGAYRPDELARGRHGEPHSLQQLLDEFRRRYGDVFVDLARADRVGGRAFVDALLDAEPNRLDSSFRQALHRQTGGHPLFTVELLRDMQRRGDLVQDEAGRWRQDRALDWETLPARVEAVIARRVDRLDDAARDILTVASVEGERFTAEVVARVLGLKARPLLHTLSRQMEKQHRLVREQGEVEVGGAYLSSYRFSHALFHQYLYRQLPAGERRRLHGDVAAALADFYAADLDQVVVQLAHHYRVAAAWDKAVPYLTLAGDLAYDKASLSDAARHYQVALDHWPPADPVGQAATWRKVGECLWVLGRHREAIVALETSHDLSRSAGDRQGRAAARRLLGRVYWEAGQPDRAGQLYKEALAILEDEPESEEMAWALAGLANYHMHLGEYERSIALGERALALARRLDAGALIVQCLCDLGSALSGKGDWGGVALERESLVRALEMNRPHDAGRAYLYVAEALIYRGRYEEATGMLEEALAYARRMHMPYIASAATRQLAAIDWSTGRWADALARLEPLIDRAGGDQPRELASLYWGITLGRAHNDLGQAETAHALLTGVHTGPFTSLNPAVAFLGEMARAGMMLGREAEAAAAAAEILEWADQARYLFPNVDLALLFICRAPVVYGRPALGVYARAAWQQLERLDDQFSTLVTAACRLEGEGWLHLDESEGAEAIAPFTAAVTTWQDLGRPYDQTRALTGLRRALEQVGDDDARSASRQAMELVDALVAQLPDPALKASFLQSPLLRALRGGSA